jgi:broad specificity phosphatase PhoE
VPITVDPRLQEIDLGIFQGLTWAEAEHQYPALCDRIIRDRNYIPIPQAESLPAVRTRAHQWWQWCLQNHVPGHTVWIVSHGGFMQHLISEILGCAYTWKLPIPLTALFEFWLSPLPTIANDMPNQCYNPECWQIKRFGETPHLS